MYTQMMDAIPEYIEGQFISIEVADQADNYSCHTVLQTSNDDYLDLVVNKTIIALFGEDTIFSTF